MKKATIIFTLLLCFAAQIFAADTYTSVYHFRLPDLDIEDEVTPWGLKYNNNFTLIDAAMAGVSASTNSAAVQLVAVAASTTALTLQAQALAASTTTLTLHTQALAASTTTLTQDLATEVSNRQLADLAIGLTTGTLRTDLTAETSRATTREDDIGVSTGSIYSALNSTASALTAETAARISADAGLLSNTATIPGGLISLSTYTFGDNLGNHIATKTVTAGYGIAATTIAASGTISAASYWIGSSTIAAILPGTNSIAYGINAGAHNTVNGDENVFIGNDSGKTNTDGYSLTAVGLKALEDNTTGTENTAIGMAALANTTSGSKNTASGASAIVANTTGNANTGSGYKVLYFNTSGSQNTVAGYQALLGNYTGSANSIVGYESGYGAASYSFSSSTLMGYRSGYSLTTGNDNIFLGWKAGYNVTTGTGNIIIGYDKGPSAPTASNELNIGGLIIGDTSASSATIVGNLYANGFYGSGANITGVVQKAGDTMTGPLTLAGSTLTVTGASSNGYGLTVSSNVALGGIAFTANNRFGVGTTSPTATMEVVGQSKFTDGSGAVAINTPLTTAYSSLGFQELGAAKAEISYIPSGYVTTSRQKDLEIVGNSAGDITVWPGSTLSTTFDRSGHVYFADGITMVGTATVQGSAFSVGRSTLVVDGGNVTMSSGTFSYGTGDNQLTMYPYGISMGNTSATSSVILNISNIGSKTYIARLGDQFFTRYGMNGGSGGNFTMGEAGVATAANFTSGNNKTASPAMTFVSSTALATANDFEFRDGSTALMTISKSGNVGIGTTSPDQKLTVAGNISTTGQVISSGTGSNYFAGGVGIKDNSNLPIPPPTISLLQTSNSTNPFGAVAWIGGADVSYSTAAMIMAGIGNAGLYPWLGFYTANTSRANSVQSEKMRITYDGKIGIGTTSPATKLHLSSGTVTVDGTGSPAKGAALCLTASGVLGTCTAGTFDACTCTAP
jgi:hypothetical protein